MEIVSLLISLVALGITGFSFFYLKKENEKMEGEIIKLKNWFNRVVVEDIMFSEKTQSKGLFKESVLNLARMLFSALKRKYNFKATNYAEFVEELKEAPINPKVKEELIDFFSSIIILEYSKESLNAMEKTRLKRKAIEMIRRMGRFPIAQE